MGWGVPPARAAPRGVRAPQTLPEGLPRRLQSPAASSCEGHGLQSRREAAVGSVEGVRKGPGGGEFCV